MIRTKRVYDPAETEDGTRFLVDRLWPRGMRKASLAIEEWLKDVSPSNDLRWWYHHQPSQWDEFRRRYFKELDTTPESWLPLLEAAREGIVTLLYSSADTEHNNAVALREFLSRKLRKEPHR